MLENLWNFKDQNITYLIPFLQEKLLSFLVWWWTYFHLDSDIKLSGRYASWVPGMEFKAISNGEEYKNLDLC